MCACVSCLHHTFHPTPARNRTRTASQVLHKKTIGQTQAARDGLEANKTKCEMCYCFVCDGPASECQNWAGNALTAETAHCLASNQGVNASTWTRLRDAKKNPGGTGGGGSSSGTGGSGPNPSAAAALAAILAARSGSSSGSRRGASWTNASRRLQDRLENLYGSRPGGSQSRAERMLAALAGRTVDTGLFLAQILRTGDAPAGMAPILLAYLVRAKDHLRAAAAACSTIDTLLSGKVPVLKGRAPLAAAALREPVAFGGPGIIGLERTLADGILGGSRQIGRSQTRP